MPAAARWRFGPRRDWARLSSPGKRVSERSSGGPALLRARPCARTPEFALPRSSDAACTGPKGGKTLPPTLSRGREQPADPRGDTQAGWGLAGTFPRRPGDPCDPQFSLPDRRKVRGPLGPDRSDPSRRGLPPRAGALAAHGAAGAWGPRAEGGHGARWGRGSPGRPPEALALRNRRGAAAALPLPQPCTRFCPYPSESLGRE